MRNKYIEAFENAQIAEKSVPEFRAGDTLRIAVRIKEGDKTRVQNFEGICIARRGSGTGETFIRRAKLFYLRDRRGKAARIKELKR